MVKDSSYNQNRKGNLFAGTHILDKFPTNHFKYTYPVFL